MRGETEWRSPPNETQAQLRLPGAASGGEESKLVKLDIECITTWRRWLQQLVRWMVCPFRLYFAKRWMVFDCAGGVDQKTWLELENHKRFLRHFEFADDVKA